MNGLFIELWARWKEANKDCAAPLVVAVESHHHGEPEGQERRWPGNLDRLSLRRAAGRVLWPSVWEPATPRPAHRHRQGARTVNARPALPPALPFLAGTHRGLDSASTQKPRKLSGDSAHGSAPRDRASGEAGGAPLEAKWDVPRVPINTHTKGTRPAGGAHWLSVNL